MAASQSQTSAEPADAFTVLVVDDHDDNRDLLRVLLRRHGVSVIEAHNGVEAIKMAYSKRPHLILMDISMPVMDGLDSVRQLKGVELTRSIPIVVVSAHCGDPQMNRRALDAGCLQCIAKPIELKEIIEVVEQVKAQGTVQ